MDMLTPSRVVQRKLLHFILSLGCFGMFIVTTYACYYTTYFITIFNSSLIQKSPRACAFSIIQRRSLKNETFYLKAHNCLVLICNVYLF